MSDLNMLPLTVDVETKAILKQLSQTYRFLAELKEGGLLKKEKIGKNNYFINEPLFILFKNFDLASEI